jgi:hypothetical protein
MAVTMKKTVFWDVAPCRYCVNATDCTYSLWFARGILLVFYSQDGGDTFLRNVG